ncbi:DEHA2A10736p [Debaryomyces hansenii CBS767]|uniref:DEHA2A10736p n=1 Tax=Debaryomyces hansenii (strain ATCC 36239 / CBS 767 / BCRC 21394 / JCM 1990 / NBRC 0083 / IGC 2968) TaxID=284592 RepID=Q6BYC0_DEBHA|nr:DEHA2A10736p [Debaryomyces hansenii CBS767]CAG84768.2 DEHA2A10736p [Debaryomyces hansenii CBS767]|eukprot:XP_456799.2 DEHA2A10736p [Debaryomyces hansenii CBS767]
MDISSYDNINPQKIPLNYTLPLGNADDVYVVTFGVLDEYVASSFHYIVVYSVAIGACLTLSLALWASCQNKRTPIFVLNQLTMAIMMIESALYLAFFMGPLSSLSFSFTGILIPNTYGSYRVTVAANVFQTILVACIEVSMTYQIFIIFRSPEVKRLGAALTIVAAAAGLTIVGFYINSTVSSARMFQDVFNHSTSTKRVGSWVTDIPFILFSASINLMSCMLACKLFFAIKTRRYLGLKQFDSFHILFIMSTQTMFIPSILVLINYGVSEAKTNVLSAVSVLLVVLSLPFSSMWASAANNNPTPTSSTLAFLNRSDSNNSDSSTIVGNRFSLFPGKLSKSSTTDSSIEKTMKDLSHTTSNHQEDSPTTLTDFRLQNDQSFYFSNLSAPPSDIEQIIYGVTNADPETSNKCLNYSSDRESIDRALDNASPDGFVAVTTHNVNQ